MTHSQLPCDLLPPHLAELCCGDSPRFTARQCFAHANAWRSKNGLPELTPLEVHNAKSTPPDHAAKAKTVPEPKPPREKPQRATLPPCVHLRDVIRDESCRLCGGRSVTAHVHGCEIHGECTQNNYGLKGAAKYLATCIRCLDYSEIGGLETVSK